MQDRETRRGQTSGDRHAASSLRAGHAADRDKGPVGYSIRRNASRDRSPFDAANALLREHALSMRQRLLDAPGNIATSWSKLVEVQPPIGGFHLVTDPDGARVGSGAMRRVSGGAAEMKHLCVHPDARRHGFGRWLLE